MSYESSEKNIQSVLKKAQKHLENANRSFNYAFADNLTTSIKNSYYLIPNDHDYSKYTKKDHLKEALQQAAMAKKMLMNLDESSDDGENHSSIN